MPGNPFDLRAGLVSNSALRYPARSGFRKRREDFGFAVVPDADDEGKSVLGSIGRVQVCEPRAFGIGKRIKPGRGLLLRAVRPSAASLPPACRLDRDGLSERRDGWSSGGPSKRCAPLRSTSPSARSWAGPSSISQAASATHRGVLEDCTVNISVNSLPFHSVMGAWAADIGGCVFGPVLGNIDPARKPDMLMSDRTCARNRSSARMRPGRPTNRQCSPTYSSCHRPRHKARQTCRADRPRTGRRN